MARKRNKTDEKPVDEPESGEPAPGNWLTGLLFRPRVLLLLAAGVVLTVAVPLCRERLPDLSERAEYRLRAADVTINQPPRYVPENLVEQVAELAELPEELSILDDGLVARVAAAFERHPWVAEVVEVKKGNPARVAVTLRYRRPVAMVEVRQGLYPVDVDGHLLPPADFSIAEAERYPLVRNVQSTPHGPAGTSWGDVAVAAAAKLADALHGEWAELNLAAINVSRQTKASPAFDDVQFELLTRGGSRILWGRAPGSNHPGELEPAQKIGRLKKYHADFGGFDEPHGPYEIDIRHWQEISRRPLVGGGREARNRRGDHAATSR